MRVTLRDIAAEAGVSLQTVSNVVRGNTARVSAATTKRVRAIIADRGYVPNASARSLAANSSRTIGLLVPAGDDAQPLLSPYDVDMLGSLEREFRSRGFDLLLRGISDVSEVRDVVHTWNLFGAVLLEFSEPMLEGLDPLDGSVLVGLDGHIRNPAVLSVRADDEQGGRIAARRLIEAGHRHVAFAGRIGEWTSIVRARLDGFRAELAAAGLPEPEHLAVPLSHEAGYSAAAQWRSPAAPTAVFAAADILAIGLMQGLTDAGIRVPDDVSVIGFDDLAAGRYVTPRLTTIAQDFTAKSAAVAALLFGEADATPPVVTAVRLIERGSVAVRNSG